MTIENYSDIQKTIEQLNEQDEYFIPHSIHIEDNNLSIELYYLGNYISYQEWKKLPEKELMNLNSRFIKNTDDIPNWDLLHAKTIHFANGEYKWTLKDKKKILTKWLDKQFNKSYERISEVSLQLSAKNTYRNPLFFNRVVLKYIIDIYEQLDLQKPDAANRLKKIPVNRELLDRAMSIPIVYKDYFKKTSKGRKINPQIAKRRKELDKRYLELKDTLGYTKTKSVEFLCDEFPEWKKATIETYIKR